MAHGGGAKKIVLGSDGTGNSATSRISFFLLLAAVLLLPSCVHLQQYHTLPEICAVDTATDCAAAYVEDHPEYLLGFVEFDDLGWAWDRDQGRVLLKAIAAEAERGDVLMVVFAHGWKHNASTCDTNVACFRETLSRLHASEVALAGTRRAPRRIVGIYVGWRGSSAKGKILAQTTFYGRKKTAQQVGSGAVTELIVRLAEIREARLRADPNSTTRLITVGHSFGGALIFSATSQLMMERLSVAYSRPGPVRGLGDLVVLVNPAFEAALFQPLHANVTEIEDYPPEQRPVFAIFTSVGDSATGRAFPLGRFFSARLDDYRTDEMRDQQKRANRAAVGHFEDFRTHFLKTNEGTLPPEKVDEASRSDCGCPYLPAAETAEIATRQAGQVRETLDRLRAERAETGGAKMDFPTATLQHEKFSPFSPIFVVSVDDRIITKHNDIYRPSFIDFLRHFLLLASEPVEPEATLSPAFAFPHW